MFQNLNLEEWLQKSGFLTGSIGDEDFFYSKWIITT